MPNLSEIEVGLQALESAAPTVERFLDEIPEIFGAAGKTFQGGPAAEDVAARLFNMPRQAPMRDMLRAALGTDHPPTLSSVRNFFRLPSEARCLLDGTEITRMTGLLRQGTSESLGEVRSTIGTLGELGQYAKPDRTGAEVLQSVRQSGILGENQWLGRHVTLAFKGS